MHRVVKWTLMLSCIAVSDAQQTTHAQVSAQDTGRSLYDVRLKFSSAGKSPSIYFVSRGVAGHVRAPDAPARSGIACTTCFVDADATGSRDGTSWANAFTSLSEALAAADSTVVTIRVGGGRYTPDTTGLVDLREARFALWKSSGALLLGGYAGVDENGVVAANPDEQDPSRFLTVLSGDLGIVGDISDNSYNVFRTDNVSSGTVDGFLIRDGNANNAAAICIGGGMSGGLCQIFANNPCGEGDPGICTSLGFDKGGGGYFGGNVTLRNLTLINNVARDEGGGLYLTFSGADDAPTVENCRFADNIAGSGGGLSNFSAFRATVRNSVFERNAAIGIPSQFVVGSGGAIKLNPGNINLGANRMTLDNCDFISNRAVLGGAIESGGSPTLTNVRFLNNSAAFEGGALLGWGAPTVVAGSGEVTLRNATVCENASAVGAGGFSVNEGNLDVRNSIFWGNTAFAIGELGNTQIALREAPLSTVSFSDVEGGWEGGGSSNLDIDPMLSPDGHLLAASPLINAGDPTYVPDPAAANDSDGDLRLVGVVDVGADEFLDSDGDGLPDYWVAKFASTAVVGFGLTGLECGGDPDGDGITNCEEYELFSSDPVRDPIYVDPVIGDDANDGSAAAVMGGGVGPMLTLRAAMAAAERGTTVLAAAGEYLGPDNRALDFEGKGMILRAVSGRDLTSINMEGFDRAFVFSSQETSASAIMGFTIRNGLDAEDGGLLALNASVPQLRDVTFDNARIFVRNAGLRMFNVAMKSSALAARGAASAAGGLATVAEFDGSHLRVEGAVTIEGGTLTLRESCIDGPSAGIEVRADAKLEVAELLEFDGTRTGIGASLLRAGVFGAGELRTFPEGVTLRVDGSASATAMSVSLARVDNVGRLTMRAAGLKDVSSVDSKRLRFEPSAALLSASATGNTLRLVESTPGFGGETTVRAGTTLQSNIIESEGDRVFNLDPDPSAALRPTLIDNLLFMRIRNSSPLGLLAFSGISPPPKTSFELRTTDLEFLVAGGVAALGGTTDSGAFELANSTGYSDTWAFERITIDPGALLGLTNRRGFDFRTLLSGAAAAAIPQREVIYVKELIIGDNAILNTARQRLYYQTLQLGTDARIVDSPLQGLSLQRLAFASDTEFDVRLRARLTDPVDFVASTGNAPAVALPRGAVERFADMLRLRTHDPSESFFSATSVSARAEFARLGDEDIMVAFRYRFSADPNSSALLKVYLGETGELRDAAEPGGNLLLATISPPKIGRRGSVDSTEMATFVGTFSRGSLNLKAGSFLEFELRGKDAVLIIDDIEPFVPCAYLNADISGDEVASKSDFLYAVSSLGRDVFRSAIPRTCLDLRRSSDLQIDVQDLLLLDLRLDDPTLLQLETSAGEVPESSAANNTLLASNRLVLSAKSTLAGDQEDALYSLRYASISIRGDGRTMLAADAFDDPTQLSASTPGINGFRANGRMTKDMLGDVYQIHARQGLIRVKDSAVLVPPRQFLVGDKQVRVGLLDTLGAAASGGENVGPISPREVPFLDASFSRSDPNVVFVAPVTVIRADGSRYKAGAKLRLQEGDPPYLIERIYGLDPLTDETDLSDPPQFRQIDVQRIREIEVGGDDELLLLSSKGIDQNDWLLRYSISIGSESEERFLLNAIAPGFKNPAAMRALSDGTTIAIATSLDVASGSLARIYRFKFQTLAGAGASTTSARSLILEETAEIANMDVVTAITEGPGGALLVSGLRLGTYDEFRLFQDSDPIDAIGVLAVACVGRTFLEAADIDGFPISLALGSVITCSGEECPDLCAEAPVDAVVPVESFDRALGMIIPASSAGSQTAYRVTLVTLYDPADPQPVDQPDYSGSEGEFRYLNLFRDGDGNMVTDCVSSAAQGTTYPCVSVGCLPEFADWGKLFGGVTVYVSGNAIIPDSTYTVAHLAPSCAGSEASCLATSAEVPCASARYGDVQPDGIDTVADVVLTVDVVKQLLDSAWEYQVYVRKENPAPHIDATGVGDIVARVDALKLFSYALPLNSCP